MPQRDWPRANHSDQETDNRKLGTIFDYELHHFVLMRSQCHSDADLSANGVGDSLARNRVVRNARPSRGQGASTRKRAEWSKGAKPLLHLCLHSSVNCGFSLEIVVDVIS